MFSLLLPTWEVLIKQLEDLPLILSLRQHCLLAVRAPPNCCFGVGCVKGQRKTIGLIFHLSVHFSWAGTWFLSFMMAPIEVEVNISSPSLHCSTVLVCLVLI